MVVDGVKIAPATILAYTVLINFYYYANFTYFLS